MHPQLQSIATEFRAATDRMYKLVSTHLWRAEQVDVHPPSTRVPG